MVWQLGIFSASLQIIWDEQFNVIDAIVRQNCCNVCFQRPRLVALSLRRYLMSYNGDFQRSARARGSDTTSHTSCGHDTTDTTNLDSCHRVTDTTSSKRAYFTAINNHHSVVFFTHPAINYLHCSFFCLVVTEINHVCCMYSMIVRQGQVINNTRYFLRELHEFFVPSMSCVINILYE